MHLRFSKFILDTEIPNRTDTDGAKNSQTEVLVRFLIFYLSFSLSRTVARILWIFLSITVSQARSLSQSDTLSSIVKLSSWSFLWYRVFVYHEASFVKLSLISCIVKLPSISFVIESETERSELWTNNVSHFLLFLPFYFRDRLAEICCWMKSTKPRNRSLIQMEYRIEIQIWFLRFSLYQIEIPILVRIQIWSAKKLVHLSSRVLLSFSSLSLSPFFIFSLSLSLALSFSFISSRSLLILSKFSLSHFLTLLFLFLRLLSLLVLSISSLSLCSLYFSPFSILRLRLFSLSFYIFSYAFPSYICAFLDLLLLFSLSSIWLFLFHFSLFCFSFSLSLYVLSHWFLSFFL